MKKRSFLKSVLAIIGLIPFISRSENVRTSPVIQQILYHHKKFQTARIAFVHDRDRDSAFLSEVATACGGVVILDPITHKHYVFFNGRRLIEEQATLPACFRRHDKLQWLFRGKRFSLIVAQKSLELKDHELCVLTESLRQLYIPHNEQKLIFI